MPNSHQFEYDSDDEFDAMHAGAGRDPENPEAPLIQNQGVGYSNPMLDEEDLKAAMQGERLSVVSGGAGLDGIQVEETQGKSAGQGKGASLEEVKKAAGEVIKKDESAPPPWWAAPLVVVAFITFDSGKLLAERVATHGTTINTSIMGNMIQIFNLVVAFTWTILAMGVGPGMAAMFNWKRLSAYILPSAMFSISQVLNLLQNMYISGATRKVFSQLRIPLTALFSMLITGAGYTTLQWMMIFSITIAVFEFQMMQEPTSLFNSSAVLIGLVLSILTNIGAVLGSLFGEKIMKESKKLPFNLQKFQFELWTFAFGLFGTFFLVPFVAFLLDVGGGHPASDFMTGPEFVKNWPLTYRVAAYGQKSALAKVEFEAKYATGEDSAARSRALLPNRYDMAYWTTSADMRTSGEMFGETVGAEAASVNTYETLQKLHQVMKKRRDYTGKDIGNWENRVMYVNKMLAKTGGRMGAHGYYQLRHLGGPEALMMDTKFYLSQPFFVSTKMGIHRTIASSFVMAIGDQTTERNYKIGGKATPAFTALSIARRDSPHLDASVFRQNAKDDYATGVDGLTGSPKPDSYFTLTQDVVAADVGCDAEDDESVQLFEGDVAACIKDRVMRDLLSEAPAGPEKEKKDASGNALPLTPEQEEANRKAKGAYFNFVKSIVGKQQASGWVKIIDEKIAENRLSPEDAAKEAEDINSMHEAHVERKKLVEAKKEREARLAHYQKVLGAMKEVDAKVAGNDNAEMKMNIFKTFAFGKAAYYTRADKTLRMAITRDSTLTVSKLVEGDANQVISLSKKITEKLVYDFEGCDAALDFKEDSFVAKDTKCKLVKADILPAGKVVTTFAGASPKPDADPEEAAAKKKQSGKEAKNKWLAKPLEERKASVESAWVPFWKKESKAVAASESFFFSKLHFGEKKDLLGENRDTKFKLQVHKAHELMSDRIGSEQAAVEVHTYPGEVAAGVNGGCTLEMCNLSEDQWEQSFGFYGTWVGGSRSWRKVKPYFDMDADPAKAAEYLAKPFAFAELHGYTMSPVPGGFISMAFFLGILLNAGQSWMSAYIAKVLSSLWKNICAAIALVVVVLVEKTFLDDTIKKAETDWTRVVFGMCGVIFTVLVFQMSPKEKKH